MRKHLTLFASIPSINMHFVNTNKSISHNTHSTNIILIVISIDNIGNI